MDGKQRAAEAAIEEISSGMTVGMGTGSTAQFFIQAVGEALCIGKLKDIVGVPTSVRSEQLAKSLQIPVKPISEVESIDVTVDGADEVAPGLDLIKGLGGALLREKIVAQNSKRLVIIADESKIVSILGSKSSLPVEVAAFGYERHADFLSMFGCKPTLRRGADGNPFFTDNGNHVYDCKFERIDVPAVLDAAMRKRAGIIETGLFLGIARLAIIGYADRVERRER